jgi:ribonuclease-3
MATPLEKKIGYTFKDTALLKTALTHSSLRASSADNERLEFLGDRVLGLAMAQLLFARFPSENEGSLAKRHTALVQQKALAAVAREIGLSTHLKLSGGEAKSGGAVKDKILSDAVEALVGAVFLDGGYKAADQLVQNLWRPLLAGQDAPPEDAKSALQEWAQARGLPLPKYKQISKSGSDHAPQFEVEVTVEGIAPARATAASKRAAEKAAAEKLIAHIRTLK